MEGIQLYLEQLAVICRKEILAIWQDKATRLIIVVPCIILGFLFGYAANYNLEKAPYAVIDLSHSKESAELISRIDGTGFFQRAVTLQNAEEISDYINRGEVVMAVSIPPDFSRRLNHAQEAPVQVIADGRNTVIAGQVIGHMGQIISRYNQERSGSKSPVALEMRTWFNPNQITRWFFLPGIIGLLSFFPGLSALGPFRRPGTGRRNVRADLGGAHFRAHYPHRQSRSTHDCRHHPVYDPAFYQSFLVQGLPFCRVLS